MVGVFQLCEKYFSGLANFGRDLGKPNNRLDGFNLTKERTNSAVVMVPPVMQKARGFRSNLPVTRIRQLPPSVHMTAKLIYNRSRIVLLFFFGKPFSFIKYELLLICRSFPL